MPYLPIERDNIRDFIIETHKRVRDGQLEPRQARKNIENARRYLQLHRQQEMKEQRFEEQERLKEYREDERKRQEAARLRKEKEIASGALKAPIASERALPVEAEQRRTQMLGDVEKYLSPEAAEFLREQSEQQGETKEQELIQRARRGQQAEERGLVAPDPRKRYEEIVRNAQAQKERAQALTEQGKITPEAAQKMVTHINEREEEVRRKFQYVAPSLGARVEEHYTTGEQAEESAIGEYQEKLRELREQEANLRQELIDLEGDEEGLGINYGSELMDESQEAKLQKQALRDNINKRLEQTREDIEHYEKYMKPFLQQESRLPEPVELESQPERQAAAETEYNKEIQETGQTTTPETEARNIGESFEKAGEKTSKIAPTDEMTPEQRKAWFLERANASETGGARKWAEAVQKSTKAGAYGAQAGMNWRLGLVAEYFEDLLKTTEEMNVPPMEPMTLNLKALNALLGTDYKTSDIAGGVRNWLQKSAQEQAEYSQQLKEDVDDSQAAGDVSQWISETIGSLPSGIADFMTGVVVHGLSGWQSGWNQRANTEKERVQNALTSALKSGAQRYLLGKGFEWMKDLGYMKPFTAFTSAGTVASMAEGRKPENAAKDGITLGVLALLGANRKRPGLELKEEDFTFPATSQSAARQTELRRQAEVRKELEAPREGLSPEQRAQMTAEAKQQQGRTYAQDIAREMELGEQEIAQQTRRQPTAGPAAFRRDTEQLEQMQEFDQYRQGRGSVLKEEGLPVRPEVRTVRENEPVENPEFRSKIFTRELQEREQTAPKGIEGRRFGPISERIPEEDLAKVRELETEEPLELNYIDRAIPEGTELSTVLTGQAKPETPGVSQAPEIPPEMATKTGKFTVTKAPEFIKQTFGKGRTREVQRRAKFIYGRLATRHQTEYPETIAEKIELLERQKETPLTNQEVAAVTHLHMGLPKEQFLKTFGSGKEYIKNILRAREYARKQLQEPAITREAAQLQETGKQSSIKAKTAREAAMDNALRNSKANQIRASAQTVLGTVFPKDFAWTMRPLLHANEVGKEFTKVNERDFARLTRIQPEFIKKSRPEELQHFQRYTEMPRKHVPAQFQEMRDSYDTYMNQIREYIRNDPYLSKSIKEEGEFIRNYFPHLFDGDYIIETSYRDAKNNIQSRLFFEKDIDAVQKRVDAFKKSEKGARKYDVEKVYPRYPYGAFEHFSGDKTTSQMLEDIWNVFVFDKSAIDRMHKAKEKFNGNLKQRLTNNPDYIKDMRRALDIYTYSLVRKGAADRFFEGISEAKKMASEDMANPNWIHKTLDNYSRTVTGHPSWSTEMMAHGATALINLFSRPMFGRTVEVTPQQIRKTTGKAAFAQYAADLGSMMSTSAVNFSAQIGLAAPLVGTEALAKGFKRMTKANMEKGSAEWQRLENMGVPYEAMTAVETNRLGAPGSMLNNAFNVVTGVPMYPFRFVENYLNRQPLFFAGQTLAEKNPGKAQEILDTLRVPKEHSIRKLNPKSREFHDAFGDLLVDKIHFRAEKYNVPDVLQTKTAKLIAPYKTFLVNYYSLMLRMVGNAAEKRNLKSLEPIVAFTAANMLLGGRDVNPFTAIAGEALDGASRKVLNKPLKDVVLPVSDDREIPVGRMLEHGVMEPMAGIRVGPSMHIFRPNRYFEKPEEMFGRFAQGLWSLVQYPIAENMREKEQRLNEIGEAITPRIVKKGTQAAEIATTGRYESKYGSLIEKAEPSAKKAIIHILGFTPEPYSQAFSMYDVEKELKNGATNIRHIVNERNKAYLERNTAEVKELNMLLDEKGQEWAEQLENTIDEERKIKLRVLLNILKRSRNSQRLLRGAKEREELTQIQREQDTFIKQGLKGIKALRNE